MARSNSDTIPTKFLSRRLAEGFQEGYAEGFQEGYAEGFQKGYAEHKFRVSRKLPKEKSQQKGGKTNGTKEN